MEFGRQKQLVLAWCANRDPGPLTPKEQEFFSELHEKYLTEAKHGDKNAQFDLGFKSATGIFVTRDFEKAAYWLSRSAEQRDPDALSCLAVLHFYGAGVPRSESSAFTLMSQAADLGNFVAQFYVGWMHEHGKGTPTSSEHSLKWFRSAALNPKSTGFILTLEPTASDITQPVLPRIRGLDEMNAIAHFEVGWAYHHGIGISQDFLEAEKWYLAAAQLGHARAQNELGMLCARGLPEKRMSEAVQWWRKAAEEGVAQAALNFAISYSQGDGITKDIEQATLWAQKAATSGAIEANILLGNLEFQKTPPCSGSLLRAIGYFRKSALAGNVGGQYSVGLAYQKLAVTNQRELDSALAGSPAGSPPTRYIWFDAEKRKFRVITDSPEHIARLAEEFDPSEFPPEPQESIDQALLWFWLARENGFESAKGMVATFEKLLDKPRIDSLRRRYEQFRIEFNFEINPH